MFRMPDTSARIACPTEMAIVFIPAQLRDLSAGVFEVEMDVGSVREVIAGLEQRFPGIQERLCQDGQIVTSLQVCIDGAMSTRGMLAKIGPTSEVHFLPAISGG